MAPGGGGPRAWAPVGLAVVLELWAALTCDPGVESVVMVPPEPQLL